MAFSWGGRGVNQTGGSRCKFRPKVCHVFTIETNHCCCDSSFTKFTSKYFIGQQEILMDQPFFAIPVTWPLRRVFIVNLATGQQRAPSPPYSQAPSSHGTFIFSSATGGLGSCQRSVKINPPAIQLSGKSLNSSNALQPWLFSR